MLKSKIKFLFCSVLLVFNINAVVLILINC